MTAPLIYAVHPKTTYGTRWAREAIADLAKALPCCQIVDPESFGWSSDAEWLAAWPGILASLSGLVLVAADDTSVGAGCLREWIDAAAAGLPCAVWEGLELVHVGALLVNWPQSRARTAEVLGGPPVLPGWPLSESRTGAVEAVSRGDE